MKNLFKQNINSAISISATEMDIILSAFKAIEIKKGEILIKQGSLCEQYYFLEKGLLRFVYNNEGIDNTTWVIFEGIFFTEIISLKSKKETNLYMEAIEPSIVLSISEKKLNELCNTVIPFEKYLRLTWEENLYHAIQMKLLQQFSSAKERYEKLIQDKRLTQRIPQKYLASILGITQYSLSRLRGVKKNNF